MKLMSIGCAPSSGSTFLADLLDSAPGVLCPPELYIYCDPSAYLFDTDFKRAAINRVPYQPNAIYAARRPFFNEKYCEPLGVRMNEVTELCSSCANFEEFLNGLGRRLAEGRGRHIKAFCEKTPININESVTFCETFPQGTFVHLSRHPFTAIPSIQRRGFTFYEASLIWAYQNMCGLRAKHYSNYVHMKYEDLVASPYRVAAEVLSRIGITIDQETLRNEHNHNQFRASLPHPSSWSVSNRFDTKSAPQKLGNAGLSVARRSLFNRLSLAWTPDDKSDAFPIETRYLSLTEIAHSCGHICDLEDDVEADLLQAEQLFESEYQDYICNTRNHQRQARARLRFGSEPDTGSINFIPKKIKDAAPRLRILQGVSGQANQPNVLATSLRQRGHIADSWSIVDHPFDYTVDRNLLLPKTFNLSEVTGSLTKLSLDYDIFHFHARSFFLSYAKGLPYPSLLDLLWLKAMGKKVFFHYRGSEIRNQRLFEKQNPYHFKADELEALEVFQAIDAGTKLQLRQFVDSVCDGVFVVDKEIQSYVGQNSIIVPRAIEGAALPSPVSLDGPAVTIVHAPSRPQIKGTEYVVRAVEELKSEGLNIDFRLIQNMSNKEALLEYSKADIVVDQLRIGWYGVLAVEAFALGKPVVTYIRDDLWATEKFKLPIANANPETVKTVLKELVQSKDKRLRLGIRAQEYFRETHEATRVAKQLETLYQLCERSPSDVDWQTAFKLVDYQVNSLKKNLSLTTSELKTTKEELESLRSTPFLPRPLRRFVRLVRTQGWSTATRQARESIARRLR